jgi:Tfp pilus assembly protein FimT
MNRKFFFNAGVSVVEVVVMSAVMVIVTSIFIGGFPLFNQNVLLKKEAQDMALALRLAQSHAILGQVASGADRTPNYWGFHADTANPTQYVIFADVNANRVYDPANGDQVTQTSRFANNISIKSISSQTDPSETEINFFFVVPYGDTEIYNDVGNAGAFGSIIIAGRSGSPSKTITMRVSGQIVITN